MTGKVMGNRRNAFLQLFLLAALLGGQAPAAAADDLSAVSPARDALALMLDNQDRCLRVAHRYLSRIGRYHKSNLERARSGDDFVASEARYDLGVASRSLRITGRLVADPGSAAGPGIRAGLITMFRSQERLYGLITQPGGWQSPESFEEAVAVERYAFNVAEGLVSANLGLSGQEQREILDKHAAELYGDPGSEAFDPGPHYDPLEREMTAEEYDKKKEEYEDWLAEQDRLEAERVRRLQERQEAREKRDSSEGAGTPAVGLSSPPPPSAAAPPPPLPPKASYGAMNSWHGRYSTKIYPVKMAISQYIQVRKDGTSNMVSRSCKRMSDALATLLADPKVLSSPDPVVAHALMTSMSEFKKGADLCRLQPAAEQVKIHMRAAEQALSAAASGLGRYRLAP